MAVEMTSDLSHLKEFEFVNGGEDGEVSLWHMPCDTMLLEPAGNMHEATIAVIRHACGKRG